MATWENKFNSQVSPMNVNSFFQIRAGGTRTFLFPKRDEEGALKINRKHWTFLQKARKILTEFVPQALDIQVSPNHLVNYIFNTTLSIKLIKGIDKRWISLQTKNYKWIFLQFFRSLHLLMLFLPSDTWPISAVWYRI